MFCNWHLRTVQTLIQGESNQTYKIQTEETTIQGVTREHPFYNSERDQWIEAKNLKEGDLLLEWCKKPKDQSENVQKITQIETIHHSTPVKVYTLTVEGPEHNYFAQGVLVHNKTKIVPEVLITQPPEGAEVDIGIEIGIEGIVRHDLFEDNLEVLTGSWIANNQIICEEEQYNTVDSGGNITCTHVFTEAGDTDLTLTIVDPDNQNVTAVRNVIILANDQ